MDTTDKGGRPKKEINEEQLLTLLRCGFTRQQCCEFFFVSKQTLLTFVKDHFNMKFEELQKQQACFLKANILSNLVGMSKKQPAVAIFLAKSICGLAETPVSQYEESDNFKSFSKSVQQASKVLEGKTKDFVVGVPNDTPNGIPIPKEEQK